MNHIMVDLEALGITPECPILTLGAVFFDPNTGNIGEDIYFRVDLQSNFEAGRKPDAGTVEWWFHQSPEAQYALFDKNITCYTLYDALKAFTEFCHKCGMKSGPRIWSNGATFDVVILENAYRTMGLDIPWRYTNVLDVRTIKALARPAIKMLDFEFDGTKHNALSDAKHQAKYVSVMWQTIRSGLKN
jgi:hypothetical protein